MPEARQPHGSRQNMEHKKQTGIWTPEIDDCNCNSNSTTCCHVIMHLSLVYCIKLRLNHQRVYQNHRDVITDVTWRFVRLSGACMSGMRRKRLRWSSSRRHRENVHRLTESCFEREYTPEQECRLNLSEIISILTGNSLYLSYPSWKRN